jgi:hypothetical protein
MIPRAAAFVVDCASADGPVSGKKPTRWLPARSHPELERRIILGTFVLRRKRIISIKLISTRDDDPARSVRAPEMGRRYESYDLFIIANFTGQPGVNLRAVFVDSPSRSAAGNYLGSANPHAHPQRGIPRSALRGRYNARARPRLRKTARRMSASSSLRADAYGP